MADGDLPVRRTAEAVPPRSGPMSDHHQHHSPKVRRRALASVAALAIAASGALGVTAYETQTPAFAQASATKAPITVNAQAPASFADVVDKVKPAVVSVRVKIENAISDEDGSS